MVVAAVRGEPVLLRELCPQGRSFAGGAHLSGAGSGDGSEAGRLSGERGGDPGESGRRRGETIELETR